MMAEIDDDSCDLCEKENCTGPMKLAHKPYVFHFYHASQYKQALENYQLKQDMEENADSTDEAESNPDENWEVEEVEGEEGDDGQVSEASEDISGEDEPVEEENQDQSENTDDEHDGRSGNETPENEEEKEEEEHEDGRLETIERDENGSTNEVSDLEYQSIIPTSALKCIISDVNEMICKTIDVTMAAGVGIMAGIVSMTSGPVTSQYSPASFLNMETMTKTCLGTTLAAVGVFAGVKEIVNAVNERPPQLPVCEYCKRSELQQPGCKVFCESCGECKEKSYWKDGAEDMHCLRICNDCNTNCVLCEEKIATVKGHHKAFSTNVHGKLLTRLDGTYKDARIFGSSLLIAGILTCVVPGIGWSWGVGLIAGSVIANSGIRIIARPVVKIRCESCSLEDEAGKFEESTGCQTWCQCCGVQEGTEKEKFCMARCEDCSRE